jgi:hypothetical protein
MQGYWNGDGLIHLKNGTISRVDVTDTWKDQPAKVVDELVRLTDVRLTAGTYAALLAFSTASSRWERSDLFHLFMFSPELQVA